MEMDFFLGHERVKASGNILFWGRRHGRGELWMKRLAESSFFVQSEFFVDKGLSNRGDRFGEVVHKLVANIRSNIGLQVEREMEGFKRKANGGC